MSEDLFLKLKNKTREELKGEVNSGRFPPYVHYKPLYTLPQEKRPQPSLMMVDLKGTNENLKLSFNIMEEACKFCMYMTRVCVRVYVCIYVLSELVVTVHLQLGCVCEHCLPSDHGPNVNLTSPVCSMLRLSSVHLFNAHCHL